MGGRQSKHSSLLNDKEWTVIQSDQNQLFANVNNYASRALRNSRTLEEIQEYRLEFASEEDYLNYAKELKLRKQPSKDEMHGEAQQEGYLQLSPYIYTVRYFVNDSMEDMCSTVYKGLLYSRKVDLRLKEINDVPFPDQLCLTKSCLEGFKVLYQKMGYFDICEEMVFITKFGEVKVWINPNISKNQPYYYPTSGREPHGSQADMIVKLLDIIEQNTDQFNNDTIHFREYLVNKGILDRLSFYKALEEFELYCMEENLDLDETMRSIYQLYHPDQENNSESVKESRRDYNGFGSRAQKQKFSELERRETPNRQKRFTSSAMQNSGKMVPLQPSNVLYNSQASKRNSEYVRPSFQSVQRSRQVAPPPSFRQPTNTPQFANSTIPSLHIRRDSNHVSPQQIITPPFGFPQKPVQTSIWGNNIETSQRMNAIMSIERSAQENKKNNFVKFNYGGVCAPSIPARPAPLPPQPQSQPQPQPQLQPQSQSQLHPQQISFNSTFNKPQPVLPSEQPRPFSNPLYRNIAPNLTTAKTINTDSTPTTREQDLRESSNVKVSYYSANEIYNLDSEIAEDLSLFLGYNPQS